MLGKPMTPKCKEEKDLLPFFSHYVRHFWNSFWTVYDILEHASMRGSQGDT